MFYQTPIFIKVMHKFGSLCNNHISMYPNHTYIDKQQYMKHKDNTASSLKDANTYLAKFCNALKKCPGAYSLSFYWRYALIRGWIYSIGFSLYVNLKV